MAGPGLSIQIFEGDLAIQSSGESTFPAGMKLLIDVFFVLRLAWALREEFEFEADEETDHTKNSCSLPDYFDKVNYRFPKETEPAMKRFVQEDCSECNCKYKAKEEDWWKLYYTRLSSQNSLLMCSQDKFYGHEYVFLGEPDYYNQGTCKDLLPYWRMSTENCAEYDENPYYGAACSYAVGFRSGGVDCKDGGGGTVYCYLWRNIPADCSRKVIDFVATHFETNRTYDITRAMKRGGGAQARLSQDCDEFRKMTNNKTVAEYFYSKKKGTGAVCWDFTHAFKLTYCNYKLDGLHGC